MGEVYRARDTRLGREVALKVLREEYSEDQNLLSRFDQEARAASSLNHPNIVVVYETGEAPVAGHARPIHYLAMELIDGEPLTSLLTEEPVPLHRMLDIALQLTSGLARAHESGIIHRDLKPSNVFITSEGRVKILDFGLAKLREPAQRDTRSPTEGEALTSPGVVVGTVGYMSPEQARGEPATLASDQFSVGCVLYELLTARPAFSRGSSAETLSAILRDEPAPIERSNPAVPPPLRWIVGRCLAKSPRDRYASTQDLARDIQMLEEHLVETGISLAPATPPRISRTALLAIAAALAILGVAGALLLSPRLRRTPEPEFRRLTYRQGVVSRALLAPNGSILYTASWDGNPTNSYLALPESMGSDRLLESETQLPLAFSEDGSEVLVLLGTSRAAINARGTLAWWPSLGGRPRRILDNAGWADAAKRTAFLAVVRDAGADRVLEIRNADGALQRTLFRTPGAISYVRVSPNEKYVAFVHHPSRFTQAGEVRVAAADGSDSRPLSPQYDRCIGLDWSRRNDQIWYTASRAGVYNSSLWTVRLSGKPRLRYVFHDFFALQSVSETGDRWLLLSTENRVNLTLRKAGGRLDDFSWLGWTLVSDFSPDGKSVLFYDGGATSKSSGIWVRPLDGGDAFRLGDGVPGGFSPDGRWVVALSDTPSGPQITLVAVGAGEIRRLPHGPGSPSMPSFAGDHTILFVSMGEGRSEIWRTETDGTSARSLGVGDCYSPAAAPSHEEFVCMGGDLRRSLFAYPMEGDAGRKLYELPEGDGFVYARYDATGDRIFAVTRRWELLTVAAATGALLGRETLPLPGSPDQATLVAAALGADAATQGYSLIHASSGLYLTTGIE